MGTISGRGTISFRDIHIHLQLVGPFTHIYYRGWGHSHILQRVGSFTYTYSGGGSRFALVRLAAK